MTIHKIIIVVLIAGLIEAGAVKMPCIRWQKTYGKENRNDYCYDALLTSQNYLVITGMSQGQTTYREDGCVLMAVDTLGAMVWQRDLEQNATGVSITQSESENLYILSRYGSQGSHIIKTDISGNIVWSKPIGIIPGSPNKYNYTYQHCITSDGAIAVTGVVDIDEYNSCMYLFKMTENGTSLGGKLFSFKPEFYFKEGQVLLPDSNGSIIIGGNGVYNKDTYYNAMVLKVDNRNSELWFHEYGGKLYESVAAMAYYKNGDLAIATDRYTDLWEEKHLWLLRTTKSGDTLWSKSYKSGTGNVNVSKIFPTEYNGLLIAGSCQMERWKHTLFIGEIDSLGNMIWEFRSPNLGLLTIEAAIHMGNGEFFLLGDTRSAGTADADIRLFRVGFRETPVFTRIPDSINVEVGILHHDIIAAHDAENRVAGIRYLVVNPIPGVSLDSLSGELSILAPPAIVGNRLIQVSVVDTCGLSSVQSIKLNVAIPEDCPIKYYPYKNSNACINDSLKWFHTPSLRSSFESTVTIATDSNMSSPLVKLKTNNETFLPLTKINTFVELHEHTTYYWQVEEYDFTKRTLCASTTSFIFTNYTTSSAQNYKKVTTGMPSIRRLHGDIFILDVPYIRYQSENVSISLHDLSGKTIGVKKMIAKSNGALRFSIGNMVHAGLDLSNQLLICTIKGSTWTSSVVVSNR